MFGLSETATKVAAWTIAAAVLVTGFLVYRHSLITEGEAKVENAVKVKTLEIEAQNLADNTRIEAAHRAAITRIQDEDAKALAAADARADDINGRLRAYVASRSQAARPGDLATSAGPDDPSRVTAGVEQAVEGVVTAAGHDAAKVVGLQNYITNVCLKPRG